MHHPKIKKLLIITYYWPPSSGIGVLRCLKIAKYLRKYGWEPIIFTAKDAHYPGIDQTNERDVPKDCKILRQKIWEPYHIYKFITGKKKDENVNDVLSSLNTKAGFSHKASVWIRSNFFIPDARAMWIKPSVRHLSKYLEENPVDAIFSCGPPHTNTRIATIISRNFNIPFLSDYQDPWTQVDYFNQLILTKRGLRKHQRLEQEAFQAADAITIVSKHWKSDLERIGAKNIHVLYWGYDPDDFKDIHPQLDQKFTMSHIGLMGHDRNPTTLFEVVHELIKEEPTFADDFRLNLIGQVDYSVKETCKKLGIEHLIKYGGFVKRKEALQKTCNSNVLLLLLNQQANAKGRVPGKLFEYLASNRPILTLGPPDGDVAMILKDTKRGTCFEYSDKTKIKTHIRELYKKYRSGNLSTPMSGTIEQYSHPILTKKVAQLLNQITSGPANSTK